MKNSIIVFSSLLIFFFAYNLSSCAELYVDAEKGSDENSGTSNDEAWKTITHALYQMLPISSPMKLHVAEGIYNTENGETFPMSLVGHANYIGAGADKTIIDASGSDTPVIDIREIWKIEFIGFTITGGNSQANRLAGGINIDRSYKNGIIIKECIIRDNTAAIIGGGIFCGNSSPVISDCIIKNNKSGWGSGIGILLNASPVISRCIIEDNKASFNYNYSDGGEGGGIFCEMGSPTISDCKLSGNSAVSGAGMHFCSNSKPIITNCIIHDNSSIGDGGYQGSAAGLFLVESEGKVINSLIYGNSADQGGGIFAYGNAISRIINTTIANNSAPLESGIVIMNNAKLILTSCIIFNNDVNTSCKITYSAVEGGFEGEGNISNNPIFASGPWGDYYLSHKLAGQDEDSPCIDAGSDIPIMGYEPGWLTTRTDGIFDKGTVDMGYHYPPHVQFGLAFDPVMSEYSSGDILTLRLNLVTAPAEITADVYLIMLDPDNNFYSAMAWNKGLHPLASSFKMPPNLHIESAPFLNLDIPSTTPPIAKPGTYTFFLAALKPETAEFISNIASTIFTVNQ